MPRKKKPPQAWTSEDFLRRLFPKEAREKARKEARKAASEREKKSTNEDSS
jgi:hypothetical protein